MVYRIFVEKKKEFANEARTLLDDARNFLGITSLEDVRLFNRYDAENISPELFETAKNTVFSEPQIDDVYDAVELPGAALFALEYLPGQFDQRADSAAQCIQMISRGDRPLVKSAKLYALYGKLSDEEIAEIKNYVINPVEAREASLELPKTLKTEYEIPTSVATLYGFTKLSDDELENFIAEYGLAMDIGDIKFCRDYFRTEQRDPTITEIRMIDTYWSDHCRHTTFGTVIDSISFDDELVRDAYDKYVAVRGELGRTKPVCLMDMATLAVKYLKSKGLLDKLDESEEINACTVKIDVEVDGKPEKWLMLFKNETHNHPTEIEPFGGAATCIGGAIRDPLSGRAYVYAAMRITGAGNPLTPVSDTIPGKLSQRKIVTAAAAGYSSYGNQIGLATGMVNEIYHPGYVAKRMEIGAVVAATPAENVIREVPVPGDIVVLIGGSTGRDGIGGATGSSKAHDSRSVETCGAEVQKGNAPEERKLQRFFRNPKAARMIKRCNDFGAGGVSVAVGELADGLEIDLNAVPKKYEGLDGTELAISESQERMATVIRREDKEEFLAMAAAENLQAVQIAEIKAEPRLTLNWNGKAIADISREFLNSNGSEKHIDVRVEKGELISGNRFAGSFTQSMEALATDLNCCSGRGLAERFDSTIGAGTVLMPFGGTNQLTPAQAMAHKISVEKKHTDSCSLMSWGGNPFILEKSPFHGAYLAVVESVCRLIASGAEFKDVYLSFQEYFEKLGRDPKKWGRPAAALLGAFKAQIELGVGAIGGKDSMSGSFEDLHVPPTLISFAVTNEKAGHIVSPEFKKAGSRLYRIAPEKDSGGLPNAESLKAVFTKVTQLLRSGRAAACYTPGVGGIAEAVFKMAIGNGFGFEFDKKLNPASLFAHDYGAFLLEFTDEAGAEEPLQLIGTVLAEPEMRFGSEVLDMKHLLLLYEGKLESVYSCNIKQNVGPLETFNFTAENRVSAIIPSAKPKVLIPVFPGSNCEYDSAKAMADAGAEPEIIIIRNLSSDAVAESVEYFANALKNAQMVFIPGGFSGGDEPDGSAKFITAFFRNEVIKEQVTDLLDNRGGLMCGICNGFQALIKLGLVPYGRITEPDENSPTLTYNIIGRHQSRIVRTRIASNKSPWLSLTQPGEIYSVPISHGEGRFIASEELIRKLAENGQIATQYVDFEGNASADIRFNPNGSAFAVEGITSPDGRIFGKMGHSERCGSNLYKNIPGNYDIKMFEAAVKYFK